MALTSITGSGGVAISLRISKTESNDTLASRPNNSVTVSRQVSYMVPVDAYMTTDGVSTPISNVWSKTLEVESATSVSVDMEDLGDTLPGENASFGIIYLV
jgi:hypothetical protein